MFETYLRESEVNGVKTFKTYTKIENLKPDPNNPRDITEEKQIDLVDFISKYGEMKPVLVDLRAEKQGQLIGGNKRFEAFQKLGKTEVWIEPRDPMSDAQAFEMGTIDNMEFGHYVLSKLEAALQQYKDEVDLSKLGVHVGKIPTFEEMLKTMQKGTKEDEAPAVTDDPISVPGAIYQMGPHRVMCGSATSLDDVTKLMGGVQADMVFTDPPYNVDYEGKTKDALKIENDSFSSPQEFYQFLLDSYVSCAAVMKSGATIYVCHADIERVNFTKAFQDAGFKLAQVIIWAKQQFVMGRQDYQWQHEPILYGWKEGAGHYFVDDRKQTTLWNIDRPSQSLEHPTMKPVALVAKAIQNNTKGGDIVLDVFGGSGSTMAACQQTDRVSYTMELDPRYVDVIRKRYAKLINKEDAWEGVTPRVDVQPDTEKPQVEPEPEVPAIEPAA